MVAAAFTLTNCTQEIDAPVEPSVDGVPFEIVAKSADTKTANDGLKTVWVEGDALNLFHAEAEGTEYVNDGEFKLDGENTFKGKLAGTLEETYCYDWYAIYPYSSYITTPANTGSGYSYFGSRSDEAQTQNGNNSMAHIAGSNYPLYGVCKDWEHFAGEPVEIEMSHVSSLLEVVVKNETGKDLVVETISFTAPENIVGTFYVNFAGKELSFSDAQYVSKTANLNVKNGAAIANGQSAKFYLAIKPFVANGDITLVVNNIPKTKSVTAEEFVSGSIKTLNFSMKATDVLEKSDIEDVIDVEDNTIVKVEGLVVARYSKGFLVQDETGAILVYQNATPNAVAGDIVSVSGTKTTYAGMAQIGTPTIKVMSSGNAVTHPTPTVLDGAAMDAKLTETSISYIQYTGRLNVSGNYYNVAVEGTTKAIGSISYPEASMDLNALNGKGVKLTGYFIGVSSGKYVNTMVVVAEEVAAVSSLQIICSNEGAVQIECSTEDVTIYYTIDGSEPSETNGTLYNGQFNVTSDTEIKAIAVKEGYLDSEIVKYKYVFVPQDALTIVLSAASLPHPDFPSTSTGVTETKTYTIGGYDWTFAPSSGKFSWYDNGDYILWGKKGAYVLMPAVEGKALTSVTITTGDNISKSVGVGVYNADGTAVVSGGEEIIFGESGKGKDFTWTLAGTTANTHYQLRVTNANNAQFKTLTCIYQ